MLILVRHGRTVANATGLLQGRVDNHLDDTGRAQAAATAAVVGRPSRVIASPLLRAVQTAEAFGLPVDVDERWIELDYGDWDERPVRGVAAEEWAAWRADVGFRPPGGESLADLQARVEGAIESLAEEAAEADLVVVTHVSPMKAAVAWALGMGAATTWRMHVSQASITRIRTGPPGPALTSFNEVWHLGG
ncbi:MAG: histidine phosphatase family protein [Acidimicrobiia bacterium]|nr:histidine phosphatase family protein [Acidimicrobiia bacterium]